MNTVNTPVNAMVSSDRPDADGVVPPTHPMAVARDLAPQTTEAPTRA